MPYPIEVLDPREEKKNGTEGSTDVAEIAMLESTDMAGRELCDAALMLSVHRMQVVPLLVHGGQYRSSGVGIALKQANRHMMMLRRRHRSRHVATPLKLHGGVPVR